MYCSSKQTAAAAALATIRRASHAQTIVVISSVSVDLSASVHRQSNDISGSVSPTSVMSLTGRESPTCTNVHVTHRDNITVVPASLFLCNMHEIVVTACPWISTLRFEFLQFFRTSSISILQYNVHHSNCKVSLLSLCSFVKLISCPDYVISMQSAMEISGVASVRVLLYGHCYTAHVQ